MTALAVMPALMLAHRDPDWITRVAPTPQARALLPWCYDLWLRPDQKIPRHHWRTFGFDGGRGFGKTWAIGIEINRRVQRGEETCILLAAPTELRIQQVQIKALVETAPPWFKPEPLPTREGVGLVWPNGVKASGRTPEAPQQPRGDNASLSWLTEIVAWKPTTREEFFNNITTATRVGREQVIWDSTSKGRNEILTKLRSAAARDPRANVVVGGTMFSNVLLSIPYLQSEWEKYSGVRREEEILGRHFDEAEGASWHQLWLDRTRVDLAPALEWECVGVDPAQSRNPGSDLTGVVRGGRARDGHAYVLEDRSDKHTPEEWGDIVVSMCLRGGRVVIERNHLGDSAVFVLRSRAENKKLLVREIGKDDPWPPLDPRCIHVREVWSRESKATRAEGPAAETEAGRVHLVGEFPELEREMVTFVPERGMRSPNRFDAAVFAITELRELARERPRGDASAEIHAAAQAQARLTQTITSGSGSSSRGRSSRRIGI
jgi:phage terminase large subunit-like protein